MFDFLKNGGWSEVTANEALDIVQNKMPECNSREKTMEEVDNYNNQFTENLVTSVTVYWTEDITLEFRYYQRGPARIFQHGIAQNE